jgi:SIR2-like domain
VAGVFVGTGDGAADDYSVDDALDAIATALDERRCILFLGAGVHAPPPAGEESRYPSAHRPPIGKQLSVKLAELCGLEQRAPNEDVKNLQRVALFYEIRRSRKQLVDAVIEAVQTGKEPSPMLRALAELNFPIIMTTNYDHLLESALRDAGKDPQKTVYNPQQVTTVSRGDPTVGQPIVFKLHGDVESPESIVITDEDYIKFVLRMNDKDPYDPIPLSLKYHLTLWPTLFVGYSLLDYNLRLLFMTLRWKVDKAAVPDMYSVDMTPDPLIVDVWHQQQRYVKFIAADVWNFVPRLYERVRGTELEP